MLEEKDAKMISKEAWHKISQKLIRIYLMIMAMIAINVTYNTYIGYHPWLNFWHVGILIISIIVLTMYKEYLIEKYKKEELGIKEQEF